MGRAGQTIGIDRPLRLEWLDATAGRLAAGESPSETRRYLWSLLDGAVVGDARNSARGKTITVLAHTWLTPPAPARDMRDVALSHVVTAPPGDRIALHWAMLCATYPFFVDVAEIIGNSLTLNNEVTVAHVTRRLVATWGDRSTLRKAVPRVVWSMMQWNALRCHDSPGSYLAPVRKLNASPAVGELLVEGVLLAIERGMSLSQLVGHPALYPFDVKLDVNAVRRRGRIRLYRHGDQTDFAERAVPRSAPIPRVPDEVAQADLQNTGGASPATCAEALDGQPLSSDVAEDGADAAPSQSVYNSKKPRRKSK